MSRLEEMQSHFDSSSYDYIIVGASPSGCLLAYEILLNDPTASLLLIEAGELITTRWTTSDPFMGRNLSFVLSFLAKTYVHDLPKGPNVPKHIWTCVGKGTGGGSCVNGMVMYSLLCSLFWLLSTWH
jgi:choline dehydrogenase-like flavoprotein